MMRRRRYLLPMSLRPEDALAGELDRRIAAPTLGYTVLNWAGRAIRLSRRIPRCVNL